MMLIGLALLVLLGCGENNEYRHYAEFREVVPVVEQNFRDGCKVFGLNRNDFDQGGCKEFDGIFVFECYKKNDNTIFVGAYEADTKRILFTNNDVKIDPIEKDFYYGLPINHELEFDFLKKDKGFFLRINIWGYKECYFKPILYIFNGSKVYVNSNYNKIEEPIKLIDWYNDACIVRDKKICECFTIDGESKFKIEKEKDYILLQNKYLISYDEFLVASYNKTQNKVITERVKLPNFEKLNSNPVPLFENISTSATVTFNYSKYGEDVLIEAVAVEMGKKTGSAKLRYNLTTNELTRII